MEILFKEESYRIVGACFEVYKQMGCGFLEPVYQECLQHEFAEQRVPFASKVRLPLVYKSQPLETIYIADFVCFQQIVVEIKAAKDLNDVFRAQLHNYLRATKLRLGLLVNFGHFPKLEYERIIV